MVDKVNYSIIQNDQGNIAVQSTVKSFGLDHVTTKDIVSFYNNFSQYSAWDTGLLPVDGTGILCIRTAGAYTQFAYQHKPGLYHVNWAKHENGTAAAYYVAQPYRIIICDMLNGNLLGARMFYSPYPITTPNQPLYHVNLPNINCRGYRGNGVGWICLYQNEDWSNYPLNERIVRFIERCSGVETYNDANMSETDGTRFYAINNKPEYLSNPVLWEQKSAEEGYEWTLNPDLWIPVLVQDMDHQDRHYPNGVPLTFADAVVGDYQAYYTDSVTTKPINALIRPDKQIDESLVMSYMVKAYNSSQLKTSLLDDTFSSSQKLKYSVGSTTFKHSSLLSSPDSHLSSNDDDEDDENEDTYSCQDCEEIYDGEPAYFSDNGVICHSCFDNYYIYIPSIDKHYHLEDSDIKYVDSASEYFHVHHDTIVDCPNCQEAWGKSGHVDYVPGVTYKESEPVCCEDCIDDYAQSNNVSIHSCSVCSKSMVDFDPNLVLVNASVPYLHFAQDGTSHPSSKIDVIAFCESCSNKKVLCPCGLIKDKNSHDITPCVLVHHELPNNSTVFIDQCCMSCKSAPYLDEDKNEMVADFLPQNSDMFEKFHLLDSNSPKLDAFFYKYIQSDENPF